MGWIAKMILGAAGPYIVGATGLLLSLAIGAAAIQSKRLSSTQDSLHQAKAALIDPATRRTWQVEATERGRDLDQCRVNEDALKASIKDQNAKTDAAGAELAKQAAAAAKGVNDNLKGAERLLAAAAKFQVVPAGTGDQCGQTVARLLESLP